jgi:hypothetical protein
MPLAIAKVIFKLCPLGWLFNQEFHVIRSLYTHEIIMFVNNITLSGGHQIPIHHQAREVLHALVCPRIDVQRVFVLGQRLFEDGGSVALEAIIDAVEHRLGRDRAGELIRIWKSVIEGETLAA